MKNQKGFTLIELLVVVAIIGILSGIAFVSISGARESAYDTQIQSELSQVRSNTEQYYYDNGGEYTDYATDSDGWDKMKGELPPCSAAKHADADGITDNTDEYQINIDDQEYAAYAALCGASEEGDIHYYCVDSDGNAGEYDTLNSAGGTNCNDVFENQVD